MKLKRIMLNWTTVHELTKKLCYMLSKKKKIFIRSNATGKAWQCGAITDIFSFLRVYWYNIDLITKLGDEIINTEKKNYALHFDNNVQSGLHKTMYTNEMATWTQCTGYAEKNGNSYIRTYLSWTSSTWPSGCTTSTEPFRIANHESIASPLL